MPVYYIRYLRVNKFTVETPKENHEKERLSFGRGTVAFSPITHFKPIQCFIFYLQYRQCLLLIHHKYTLTRVWLATFILPILRDVIDDLTSVNPFLFER